MLDLVFPRRCVSCANFLGSGELACENCMPSLLPIGLQGCPVCAEPREPFDDEECSSCARWTGAVSRVHAEWRYDGAMVDAMHRVKRGGSLWVLRELVRAASPTLEPLARQVDHVVAMPAEPRSLKKRGFDVPALVTRWSGVRTRRVLELATDARSQKFLGREDRWTNMRGRFSVDEPVGGRWLLVDDVLTTGATAHAAAEALVEAGAESVDVFVLGRTPRPR